MPSPLASGDFREPLPFTFEIVIMADHRNHGRHKTHDTGTPESRARDDLRTAGKKQKPNEARNEQRDNKDNEPPATTGK
jgi:hypothetical protein